MGHLGRAEAVFDPVPGEQLDPLEIRHLVQPGGVYGREDPCLESHGLAPSSGVDRWLGRPPAPKPRFAMCPPFSAPQTKDLSMLRAVATTVIRADTGPVPRDQFKALSFGP